MCWGCVTRPGRAFVPRVRAGEDGFLRGRCAAVNAFAGAARLLQRNTAHGGFGFFLDAGFTFGFSAPPGRGEAFFYGPLEFCVIGGFAGIGFSERERAIEQGLPDLFWQFRQCCGCSLLREERLFQWLNLKPGPGPSRSSSFTRIPAANNSLRSLCAHSRTLDFSSSVLKIGTMTSWIGARRGGKISPWSSPCTMMMAPMKRVESPHEVVQQCCSTPPLSR